MSDSQERVTCPHCNKAYRWRTTLFGQRVNCKQCKNAFKVPSAPGIGIALTTEPIRDQGDYELDFDAIDEPGFNTNNPANLAAPANNGKCPNCNIALREGAVLCMNCGFNLAEGTRINTQVADPISDDEQQADQDDAPPAGSLLDHKDRLQRETERTAAAHAEHFWLDYKLPTLLAAIGGALALINILALAPAAPTNQYDWNGYNQLSYGEIAIGNMISILLNNALTCVLFFVTLVLMAAFLKSAFGSLQTVLLKVIGITLITTQVSLALHLGFDIATGGYGILSFIFRWPVYLLLFFTCCWKMLDMDSTDFKVLFVTMVFGRMLTLFAARMVLEGYF